MALEQSEHKDFPAVEHLFSPVAEAIALLSSYTDPAQHTYAHKEHELLHKELTPESIEFVIQWRTRSSWDFMYLFEFFIPFPYFKEIALFLNEIAKLSHQDYLYYLFGGEVPREQILKALIEPDRLVDFENKISVYFGDKPEFIKTMFLEIDEIRKAIHLLLEEISHSSILREHLQSKKDLYEETLQSTSSTDLEPLQLAQKLMGKEFYRISAYTTYTFIPSYFLTPHRIRLFDQRTCIIIYCCSMPEPNILLQSQELEKQLKALSDRNRIMILRMLKLRKEYGARLANALDLTTATISHHLEILKQADLVVEEKVGNIKYFYLNHERFNILLHDLSAFITHE